MTTRKNDKLQFSLRFTPVEKALVETMNGLIGAVDVTRTLRDITEPQIVQLLINEVKKRDDIRKEVETRVVSSSPEDLINALYKVDSNPILQIMGNSLFNDVKTLTLEKDEYDYVNELSKTHSKTRSDIIRIIILVTLGRPEMVSKLLIRILVVDIAILCSLDWASQRLQKADVVKSVLGYEYPRIYVTRYDSENFEKIRKKFIDISNYTKLVKYLNEHFSENGSMRNGIGVPYDVDEIRSRIVTMDESWYSPFEQKEIYISEFFSNSIILTMPKLAVIAYVGAMGESLSGNQSVMSTSDIITPIIIMNLFEPHESSKNKVESYYNNTVYPLFMEELGKIFEKYKKSHEL